MRQGKTRQDKTRQDKSRQDKTRQDSPPLSNSIHNPASRCGFAFLVLINACGGMYRIGFQTGQKKETKKNKKQKRYTREKLPQDKHNTRPTFTRQNHDKIRPSQGKAR